MFSVDWVVLVIIGLVGFLMWHIMLDPNPLAKDALTISIPRQQEQQQVPLKKPLIEKAPTLFAEPGLGGKLVDPLSVHRATPEESLAVSTVGMPFV